MPLISTIHSDEVDVRILDVSSVEIRLRREDTGELLTFDLTGTEFNPSELSGGIDDPRIFRFLEILRAAVPVLVFRETK